MNKAVIVVVVDDDISFRLCPTDALWTSGHAVDTLPDGAQLLASS